MLFDNKPQMLWKNSNVGSVGWIALKCALPIIILMKAIERIKKHTMKN